MQLLIRGARVFDGLGGVVAEQGVLVEDGRIGRVAGTGEFDGYEGPSIDGTGMSLLHSSTHSKKYSKSTRSWRETPIWSWSVAIAINSRGISMN